MSKEDVDHNKHVREVSGAVDLDSKVASFLYTLMRDHLPTGVVEEIVQEACVESKVQYTNGWLALYAQNLADRLTKE